MAGALGARLRAYAQLTRQDRPVGTWLLLWPTLTALCLAARGVPPLRWLLVFALGTWLMRSAGCAINDLADRRFDAHVKRTAGRVLATGAVSVQEAVAVALAFLLAAASLLWWLNDVARVWALVAALVAASYPLFKRFFPLPQAYLGIAFSLGIPMAYVALGERLSLETGLLVVANVFWVLAYDTEYAMVDRDDDLKLGLRSSAIFFGRADVAVVMLCYGLYLMTMAVVGHRAGLGGLFWLAWAIALALAARHYRLIRTRSREHCLRAFLQSHWLGFVLLIGVVGGSARGA